MSRSKRNDGMPICRHGDEMRGSLDTLTIAVWTAQSLTVGGCRVPRRGTLNILWEFPFPCDRTDTWHVPCRRYDFIR